MSLNFVEQTINTLLEIPITGHRKQMRFLSARYEDFSLDYLGENYPDEGIEIIEKILTNERLFSIKGIKNLLGTILFDYTLCFEKSTMDQQQKLLEVLLSYYRNNKKTGIELTLCDFLARNYKPMEALDLFEIMILNPNRKEYLYGVSVGISVLQLLYKNDIKVKERIDSLRELSMQPYLDNPSI